MTAAIPPDAITAVQAWLDEHVAGDAPHWREMAREAFLAGVQAADEARRDERERIIAMLDQRAGEIMQGGNGCGAAAEELWRFAGLLKDGDGQ